MKRFAWFCNIVKFLQACCLIIEINGLSVFKENNFSVKCCVPHKCIKTATLPLLPGWIIPHIPIYHKADTRETGGHRNIFWLLMLLMFLEVIVSLFSRHIFTRSHRDIVRCFENIQTMQVLLSHHLQHLFNLPFQFAAIFE